MSPVRPGREGGRRRPTCPHETPEERGPSEGERRFDLVHARTRTRAEQDDAWLEKYRALQEATLRPRRIGATAATVLHLEHGWTQRHRFPATWHAVDEVVTGIEGLLPLVVVAGPQPTSPSEVNSMRAPASRTSSASFACRTPEVSSGDPRWPGSAPAVRRAPRPWP